MIKTQFPRNLIMAAFWAAPVMADAADVSKQQVVTHYADLAHSVYSDSLATAQELDKAIDAFIAAPAPNTLAQARTAWKAARVPYQQSEVFRFGNAVVDDWEGQLNAWPLDEGLIDYVAGDYQYELGNEGAKANIVASQSVQVGNKLVDTAEITPELLASLNEIGGSEANVATGYHAIEFLLWGQDLNGTDPGAGQRQYTDFAYGEACTNGNCERRRDYLKAASVLLQNDLGWMVQQWSPAVAGNYRAELLADSADNGLRKILFGMGSLSLGELAGERMKVALEAHSTEDEHDCFSDNTHNSHYYNEQGIYNVYTGTYMRVNGTLVSGPSLHDLVASNDKGAAEAIQAEFDRARSQVYTLVESAEKQDQAFDQLIAAGNQAGNALVNASILALVKQTASIEQAASIIGVSNLNPDTADHQF
ncbi:imelysin family protein [Photobacterium sp. DA100]|uniref:imelysin family protein n=1 Tax=Photobacterium sp. DA100 TaxID=3027472 RepID=UPI0024794515|nr:imelysin family protein [Photobacterium sp. DA100]WEM43370.1 imelysin family protein [Photobacterium sp. DA100]